MEQLLGKTEDSIYKGMKTYLEKGFEKKEFNPEEYNEEILKKLEIIFS